MGSAQLDVLAFELAESDLSAEMTASEDLRQQVAARLVAHRERRRMGLTQPPVARRTIPAAERKNPIAAAVAERYSHTPSYRAFLAEQAERAIAEASTKAGLAAAEARAAALEAENAAAEAQVAARSALAITGVQQELLAELDRWIAPQQFSSAAAKTSKSQHLQETSTSGLTVRLYEDAGHTASDWVRAPAQLPRENHADLDLGALTEHDVEEALALDEEIAFRQAPVFDDFTIEPSLPLPANLLEFPRQLVASRKARPRIAEGPLRDESVPRSPQLRIFEVEAEQISTVPALPSVTPEWASIHLDAHSVRASEASTDATLALLPAPITPQTAPFSLRIMAASVDLLVIAAALLASVAMAAKVAGTVPTGASAVIAAGSSFALFYLLYQALCFTFADQTPGMRYARIGLCTLADENPTRAAMRRRIVAQCVAICPLGLGLVWALVDDDALGLHDRISGMYNRAY